MKTKVVILSALAPFLLVWTAWICTAFSFNVREVFQGGAFWGLSVMYWLLWTCLIGLVMDEIQLAKEVKKKAW